MAYKRKLWSQADIDHLVKHYPNTPTKTIAADLNCGIRRIYAKATSLGLRKSAEYLASPDSGRTTGTQGLGTRFEKGHTPWNKGKLGSTGLHPNSRRTQFKKGGTPLNTLPIGSYRIDDQGTLQRKINNNHDSNSVRGRGVHELVWVEANGPVPPKHIVRFKPGMRTQKLEEITLDKVECISYAENMRRNSLHRYPKEIADAMRARGVLNRRINHVEKHQ